MAQKTIAGVSLNVTDEGYLEDSSVWTKEVAAGIAAEESVELTDTHYAVLEFIRTKNESGGTEGRKPRLGTKAAVVLGARDA